MKSVHVLCRLSSGMALSSAENTAHADQCSVGAEWLTNVLQLGDLPSLLNPKDSLGTH